MREPQSYNFACMYLELIPVVHIYFFALLDIIVKLVTLITTTNL